MLYLVDKFDHGGKYYPKNPEERACINAALFWHGAEFRPNIVPFFIGNVMKMGKPRDGAQVQKVLRSLSDVWLKGSDFVCGRNSVSIADIQIYNELIQIEGFYPSLKDHASVCAWMERMRRVPHHDEVVKNWNKLANILKARL